MKYPLMSALLGLASESEPLTDQHTSKAEAALGELYTTKAELEKQVSDLSGKLATATTDLGTAQAAVTEVTGKLTASEETVATLEKWKQEQAIVDGRTEDASNQQDQASSPKAAFESEADEVISRVRGRLGL